MKYSITINTNVTEYFYFKTKCAQQLGAEYDNWTAFLIDKHTASFKFSQQKHLTWFKISHLNYEKHLSVT